jgi:Xaa-Pro aminopeptidase
MPLSLEERDRRYRLVRAEMEARGVDVLLVVGRDGSGERGQHRYLAGYGIVAAFAHYVVFPREEREPIFFSGSSPAANIGLANGWVQDLRVDRKPMDEIVAEVGRNLGEGTIGITSTIPIPIYRALAAAHGDERIVDALGCLRGPRLLKSDEELECVRRSAAVADEAFAAVRDAVRPGVTDFEVYGELRRLLHAGGCEYSMDIIDAGDGTAAGGPRGATIGAGSLVQIELTPAIDGYYTQLRVPFSSQGDRWPADWEPLLAAWESGYAAARESIRPGVTASELYAAAAEGVTRSGLEARRRAGHALGLEVDEFVSIDPEDHTVLEPRMVLVVHVPVRGNDLQLMVGGTFVITDDGHEELNDLSVLSSRVVQTA